MYSRTLLLTAVTMLSMCSMLKATPIDEVNANILAMKNNLGCTAPNGCQRNATEVAAALSNNSGALYNISPVVYATPAVAAVVGGLITSFSLL